MSHKLISVSICICALLLHNVDGEKGRSRKTRARVTAPPMDAYFEDYDLLDEKHTHPATTPAFRRAITAAIHDYGMDVFNALRENWNDEQNVAISPLSLYVALGMVTAGCAGTSKEQAMRTMHADGMDDMHIQLRHLITTLNNTNDLGCELKLANKIYVDKSMPLYKGFKGILKHDYMSSAKKVDFAKFPDKCRGKMNRFVSRQTNNKVKQLVPDGSVDTLTKMFVINALYLKTGWESTFIDARPRLQEFTYGERKSVSVAMMRNRGPCYYEYSSRDIPVSTLRMQLKGGVSMIILMPDTPGDFDQLSEDKTVVKQLLQSVYENSMGPMPCSVTMPEFMVEHSVEDLSKAHKKLGLRDVFTWNADFSKMTRMKNIYLHDSRHKTFFAVDKYGIEAAAATSYGLSLRMLPMPVLVNKPFMFIVRHDATGANLFLGRIIKPSLE